MFPDNLKFLQRLTFRYLNALGPWAAHGVKAGDRHALRPPSCFYEEVSTPDGFGRDLDLHKIVLVM